jgi:hypothetical protein
LPVFGGAKDTNRNAHDGSGFVLQLVFQGMETAQGFGNSPELEFRRPHVIKVEVFRDFQERLELNTLTPPFAVLCDPFPLYLATLNAIHDASEVDVFLYN